MPVHVILEYTAHEDAVEEVAERARTFAEQARQREAKSTRHEVFRPQGSRTFLHLIGFADSLAAEEHRTAKHTRAFTDGLDDLIEGEAELIELDRLGGFVDR